MLPKVVPPEGDTLNGIFIPGGTAVGWNLLALMRSPQHFGPDAKLFRPERFLEVDEETRAARERLVEMVFGYGRFACAGKPLAMMELSKTFFEVSDYYGTYLHVSPSGAWHRCAHLVFVMVDLPSPPLPDFFSKSLRTQCVS